MSPTNRLVLLPWDSEHFGLPLGRIEAQRLTHPQAAALLHEARSQGLHLLEATCDMGDTISLRALEDQGFRTAGIKVELDMALGPCPPSQQQEDSTTSAPPQAGMKDALAFAPHFADQDVSAAFGPARPEQAPLLAETFGPGFTDSRYFNTPGIRPERVRALYDIWIAKSVLGQFDDYCLVLTRENRPGGLCTLRLEGASARIGLFGVAAPFRGQGLGQELLARVRAWLQRRQIAVMGVVTQGSNIAALRIYGRAGFLIRRTQSCMYRRLL